jgi:hypothetical protein
MIALLLGMYAASSAAAVFMAVRNQAMNRQSQQQVQPFLYPPQLQTPVTFVPSAPYNAGLTFDVVA